MDAFTPEQNATIAQIVDYIDESVMPDGAQDFMGWLVDAADHQRVGATRSALERKEYRAALGAALQVEHPDIREAMMIQVQDMIAKKLGDF
jgi:hypothetical protein